MLQSFRQRWRIFRAPHPVVVIRFSAFMQSAALVSDAFLLQRTARAALIFQRNMLTIAVDTKAACGVFGGAT